MATRFGGGRVTVSLSAIDLFSGAGGLTHGLHAAGVEAVGAVELVADAAASYRAAFPAVELLQTDIRSVDFRRWRGVDVVAGGPPCQPFSSGGLRRGRDDMRDYLPEFVRAVLEVRPRAFIMENVPGLAVFGDYLNATLEPLLRAYRLSPAQVVNAADFGVPQSRRRLLIIGLLEGGPFALPQGDPHRHIPARAALRRPFLDEPNHSKIVYAKRPDLRPNPYHGQLFNGGGRPIDLDRPAPTILASAGGNKTHFLDVGGHVPRYHSHLAAGGAPAVGELPEARRITVLESAALQSFPSHVRFAGSRSSQYTQVGNAVPPKLAEAVGAAVADQLGRSMRRKRAAA